MNLAAILELLKQLIGGFNHIDDKSKWSVLSVQYDSKSVPGTITTMSATPQELNFQVSFKGPGDEAMSLDITGRHHSADHVKVLVNGVDDSNARLIFGNKGTITNPSRWGFDFKNLTVAGEDYRVNLRFDP